MGAPVPVHDAFLGDQGAERHSRGQALGSGQKIRHDTKMFDGIEFSGASHAGLDFIHHIKDAVFLRQCLEPAVIFSRRYNVAAFALDRLHHDDRDFFRRKNGFEQFIFDEIDAGQITGRICLFVGTPVAVGIGDNQASLLATLDDCEHQLALTIGTGAQVSAVMRRGFQPGDPTADCPYEYRPYPGERFAIVAAPLSGGVAWAWLARTVLRWQQDLGQAAIDESVVYARLNELGARAADGVLFEPLFAGERHNPTRRATISNIDLDNFSLGSVARSLARGIVRNLKSMLPPEAFTERREVVGSGNALRRNPLLAEMVTEQFEMPLRFSSDREEAAVGAALNAAGLGAS